MPSVCGVMSTSTGPTFDSGDQASLNGGAHGDAEIGIHFVVDRLAELLLEQLADHGGAAGAADEDHFVDLRRVEFGVGNRVVHALQRLRQKGFDQRFVIDAMDFSAEVQGGPAFFGDELLLDLGDGLAGELLFRFLDGAKRAGLGGWRLADVDAVFALEVVADHVQEELVEIVASQSRVAVAAKHLDDALLDLHDRDVERAAAEVVDQQPLHLVGVGVVGERGGGGLVDDPRHLQPRQHACLAGRLALHLVEEGGDGDDRLFDRPAKLLFRPFFQPPQDEGGNLLRGVLLVAKADRLARAHAPLDRPHGSLGGEDPLVARRAPTSIWPLASSPTTDGRIASPSSSNTSTLPSRMTATSLLVVPKSIPRMVSIVKPCDLSKTSEGLALHRGAKERGERREELEVRIFSPMPTFQLLPPNFYLLTSTS